MEYGLPYELFRKGTLYDFFQNGLKAIIEEVDGIPQERLISMSRDDLINEIATKYILIPLELKVAQQTMANQTTRMVNDNSQSAQFKHDTSTPPKVPELDVYLEIPFTGSDVLWDYRPNASYDRRHFGHIEFDKSNSNGTIAFNYTVRLTNAEDPEKLLQSKIVSQVQQIEQTLNGQRLELSRFNSSLRPTVEKRLDERLAMLNKADGVIKFLGIPLKKTERAPNFTPVKLPERISRPNVKPTLKGESSPNIILEEDYEEILRIIRHAGDSFEKTPGTYLPFYEEQLRDVINSHLNAVYYGDARGEVFNKSGKTDIHIAVYERNAFIAECKVWSGQSDASGAIDQLLSYLTWRDCKTALIIFNKDNKDFKNILSQIEGILKNHKKFHKLDRVIDENEWHCTMKSQHDDECFVQMRVFVFNLFTPLEPAKVKVQKQKKAIKIPNALK